MLQELVDNIASHAGETEAHGLLAQFGHALESVAETISMVIIAIGIVVALYRVLRVLILARRQDSRIRLDEYQEVRLGLARYLALALEFQLAADIVATTV